VTIDLFTLDPDVRERCIEDAEVDDARLKASAHAQDIAIRVLRGHRMNDVRSAFEEFDAVFQLPSYFGKNWAALDECMNDADWFPLANRVLVVVLESAQLYATEEDRESAMETFREFCRRLIVDWASGANGRRAEVSVLLQS
jgi:RNAse (barnase) inhibitor barstar